MIRGDSVGSGISSAVGRGIPVVALIVVVVVTGCGSEDAKLGRAAATTNPTTSINERTTQASTSMTATDATTTTVPNAAVSEDVRMYAEAFGISEDEAKASLEFQGETTGLLDDLAARFPDVYTTARYVNGADYALVVTVSGEVPTAFSEALDEVMESRREWQDRITIDRARYSVAELKRLSDEMADRLSFLEDCDGVTAVLDSERAVVTVELAEEDRELTNSIKKAMKGYPLQIDYEVTGEVVTLPNCPDAP